VHLTLAGIFRATRRGMGWSLYVGAVIGGMDLEAPSSEERVEPLFFGGGVSKSWWWRSMTYEEFRRLRSFSGLDGLRAVAATGVVLFHFGGSFLHRMNGWVGVYIFFALSGFLITTLALREVDRRGRLNLRAFYLRRFFRIVPVYLVVLSGVLGEAWILHDGWPKLRAALPYYLTFMNDIAPPTAYCQTWTLAIEQKYYLLWPLLAFVMVRRARGQVLVAVVLVAVLVPWWQVRYLHTASFIVLLLGSLLAVVMHHPRGFAVLRPLLTPTGSVMGVIIFLGFHLQLTGLVNRFGEARAIPFYGLSLCLLLLTVLGPGVVRAAMSTRPMVFVGRRSYSLYLVQFLMGTVVSIFLPAFFAEASPQRAIAIWVASVVVADQLYRWVEKPMISVGRWSTQRWARTGWSEKRPSAVVPPAQELGERPVEIRDLLPER
jgi:peptidoglycan/LPS O-acetylase OafA/YrhL